MVHFDVALQRAHHTASGWSECARPAGSSATSVRGHSVRRSPVRNLLSLDDAAWEKGQLGQLSGSPPRPSERGSEDTTSACPRFSIKARRTPHGDGSTIKRCLSYILYSETTRCTPPCRPLVAEQQLAGISPAKQRPAPRTPSYRGKYSETNKKDKETSGSPDPAALWPRVRTQAHPASGLASDI